MPTENPLWLNNRVQFARLLCELVATQDSLDLAAVAESMDLTVDEVNGVLDRANGDWEESKRRVAAGVPAPTNAEYTYEHLEAAACMWEHVLDAMRRHSARKNREEANPWVDYREAYGMAALRATVISHAPVLEAKYQEAVANGYDEGFDWEFVPQYMEDHVTRILT